MKKINRLIVMKILCMMSCMVFFGCASKDDSFIEKEIQSEVLESEAEEAANEDDVADYPLCVYVCGEVNSPGVYELPQGSRICDAIEKAGGFTKQASDDYWNQAELVSDGEMIYVPSLMEAFEQKDADDGKININTASEDQLTTIPGIGLSRAESIIKYRSDNGAFASIEDIMNVSGIGESIFENIKEYITVN